jgi:hypothetical protein
MPGARAKGKLANAPIATQATHADKAVTCAPLSRSQSRQTAASANCPHALGLFCSASCNQAYAMSAQECQLTVTSWRRKFSTHISYSLS